MKTIPHEMKEAALVDGASVLRIWGAVIMPLCRPALAALATLEFTFIYNDFFWAYAPDQDRRSATDHVGAQQPQGPVLHRNNLLAAGALLVALPTLIVFFALQSTSSAG